MHFPREQRGFVALISILMLSVVMLATTLSLAQFGLANRSFLLDLENKQRSEKLAEACVHYARISVYNDPTYDADGVTFPVDTESCTLVSVTPGGGQSIVRAQGMVHNAITNIEVAVDTATGSFLTWEEKVSF
jgi:hypothetical protein